METKRCDCGGVLASQCRDNVVTVFGTGQKVVCYQRICLGCGYDNKFAFYGKCAECGLPQNSKTGQDSEQ